MKYIIEIKPEYEGTTKGIIVLGIKNNCLCVDELAIEELEELNSDYINEHYGELQNEAYQKGINDGSLDVKQRVEGAYQRGLDDAWEAAKKISLMPPDEIEKVFTGAAKYNRYNLGYSGVEAIAKLKAYEEKQKAEDKIKVGDEVNWDGDHYIVTYINIDIDTSEVKDYDLMMWDGSVVDHVKKCSFVKTGRHFDIMKILKEIQT